MRCLYAPWRMKYAGAIDASKLTTTTTHDCDFCIQLTQANDESFFILRRFKHAFVILNAYPYNAGHLLILPLEHKATLQDISPEARTEIMELITHSTKIMKDVLGAHGVNVGINLGTASGGSIPTHLHAHVLPRWNGDTNFLPTLSNTKVVSFDLKEIYQKLKPSFDQLLL